MSEHDKLRALALALLNGGFARTRKAGSFLGQLVAEPGVLTERQFEWLAGLAERGGMADQVEGLPHV